VAKFGGPLQDYCNEISVRQKANARSTGALLGTMTSTRLNDIVGVA
jgi:hypothetical protein